MSFRGKVAAVGVGLAGIGEAPGLSHLDLTALAAKQALDEAGLSFSDVDGLFAANLQNIFAPLNVGEYLGIRPKLSEGTQIGGSSPVAHLIWGVMGSVLKKSLVKLFAKHVFGPVGHPSLDMSAILMLRCQAPTTP